MNKTELEQAVKTARRNLEYAESALKHFISAPENNVFDNLEQAMSVLANRLNNQAEMDCAGSNNCGAKEYEQEFIVDGIHYNGKLIVEYNRHDKTYYYVEESNFTYSVIDDGEQS